MSADATCKIARREFLKLAGAVTACELAPNGFAAETNHVSLILDSQDSIASSAPVKRAAEKLRQALLSKQVGCAMEQSAQAPAGSSLCVVVASPRSQLAQSFPHASALTAPESLRISPGRIGNVPAILVSAADARGYIYALLELADRVNFNSNPLAALQLNQVIEEKPANDVRCVSRYFCSEVEDKPWYYDKDYWSGYLDLLVASRFNRFTFSYGLAYDFPRGVTDDYFQLPYPYLVDVPGYPQVRVRQLASATGARLASPVEISKQERDKNFEMLRYIATETAARGLHFQLGIWTHAYEWTDSPNAYHHIEGLTPETHAPYCRDALAILLKQCPEIQGLTMRVHGESGIPEGSYPFWKTLFEAISGCGRTIEIDMHAKGVNQTMIDIANATGMPVKLGAKYSAEHQSLGYNQADIRALEIPHGNLSQTESALFSLSSGSRSFTRYGYADFLHQDAPYKVLFRVWPGTQRHLLSADPEMAAGYARTASFCGAAGLDLMEPLTFKGREGTGTSAGRCAYADASLTPKADWQKYEYYYRVWGRKLYNPDADPDTWQRYLRAKFGPGADAVETSLASSSRMLPLLTSAHLDSASNHDLWYELPTNMPIILGSEPSPYGDTPAPKCFATVSPLDPQMFLTVRDYASALSAGQSSGKYSPIEVAQWIEDCATTSRDALVAARRSTPSQSSPEFRRFEEDVLIQIGLGVFFAHKLRSAVLFEIYQQTGNTDAGKLALAHYRQARQAWADMAQRAARVYVSDISYGSVPKRRGHWSDRLPGIDTDLAAMEDQLQSTHAPAGSGSDASVAVQMANGRPLRPATSCVHRQPDDFRPGQPLSISIEVSSAGTHPTAIHLWYRHVDQAERWTSMKMDHDGNRHAATIPAAYTQSQFPLQYYFELQEEKGAAWMYPGFNKTLSNQPYFAIPQKSS